uniref:HTH cro/C1-type domain-containing protein n=1 Tax=viral metagenome TaxID=1070528 RepID=A0A6H1ZCZ8_9ZZZZ
MAGIRVNRQILDKAIILSDYNIMTICKKAGVSTQMLHYYRTGKYYPNVLIAVKLCKILDLKVDEVWNDEFDIAEEKKV